MTGITQSEFERLHSVADQVVAARLKGATVDVDRWSQPQSEAHLCKSIAAFADGIAHELYADLNTIGAPLPWAKTHKQFRLRPHELTVWAGANASYKSMLISQVMLDRAMRGAKICLASLEMTCAKVGRRMALQALCQERPERDRLMAWLDSVAEAITLYDLTGAMTAKAALAVMRYCAVELGCEQFVLDNLTKIVSVDNDAADEQRKFLSDAHRIAIETGMHVHVVAHTRKPSGGEDKPPSRYDIRGSSTISDQPDNVVMLWRNRPKEQSADQGELHKAEEPDMLLTVDKQRHGAWEGQVKLWLDRKTLRFRGEYAEQVSPYVRGLD